MQNVRPATVLRKPLFCQIQFFAIPTRRLFGIVDVLPAEKLAPNLPAKQSVFFVKAYPFGPPTDVVGGIPGQYYGNAWWGPLWNDVMIPVMSFLEGVSGGTSQ
jgi:hypothetical protein